MTAASEWVTHARSLLSSEPSLGQQPLEIGYHRAGSAAYYGLFHALTLAGSNVFAAGGEALRFQATRAFSHTAVRKVCGAYVRSPLTPFSIGYEHLNTPAPSPELIVVARAFELLQEGRYTADYDLLAAFGFERADRLVELAEGALTALATAQGRPDTIIFLTALLLADRWTRRG